MIETMIALFFAHILADFLLQTGWMIIHKKNPLVLLLHVSIVAALSYAALGFTGHWAVLALAASHLFFDAVKTYWPDTGWRAFVLDQALHGMAVLVVATQFPTLYSTGVWQDYGMLGSPPAWLAHIPEGWVKMLPQSMLLIGGFFMATRAGQIGIGIYMEPLEPEGKDGIANAGAIIGNLERGITFFAMLNGYAQVIGFLIAAKAILGFGTGPKNRKTAEYLMIGTLASYGWAMVVSLGVLALRELIA